MASVRAHDDDHLGPIYGWMIGDISVAEETARAELRAVGVLEGAGRTAADLGAGPGAQTIALAEAGYTVAPIARGSTRARICSLHARAWAAIGSPRTL